MSSPRIDPRCPWVGVQSSPNVTPRWTAISVVYQDETEAQGNHNLYIEVLDEKGLPLPNVKVLHGWPWQAWPLEDDHVSAITNGKGQADFGIYAALGKDNSTGPYWVLIESEHRSDIVFGMGLPAKHHVSYCLTFQWTVAPVPPPEPPPMTYTIDFRLSSDSIRPGEKALLSWRVSGVKAVYLDGQGQIGEGQLTVSPASTTTYRLKVILIDGSEVNKSLTLTVAAPEPPPPSPANFYAAALAEKDKVLTTPFVFERKNCFLGRVGSLFVLMIDDGAGKAYPSLWILSEKELTDLANGKDPWQD